MYDRFFAVYPKLTQHFKSTLLQEKLKKKKRLQVNMYKLECLLYISIYDNFSSLFL